MQNLRSAGTFDAAFTIVQIIFHFFWDHWVRCGIFKNGVLHMYTLEGVSSVANFITAYEESQYYQDSHFLICSVFFVSKGNLFDVYFTTLQLVLVPCGGGRTSPRTLP